MGDTVIAILWLRGLKCSHNSSRLKYRMCELSLRQFYLSDFNRTIQEWYPDPDFSILS